MTEFLGPPAADDEVMLVVEEKTEAGGVAGGVTETGVYVWQVETGFETANVFG